MGEGFKTRPQSGKLTEIFLRCHKRRIKLTSKINPVTRSKFSTEWIRRRFDTSVAYRCLTLKETYFIYSTTWNHWCKQAEELLSISTSQIEKEITVESDSVRGEILAPRRKS